MNIVSLSLFEINIKMELLFQGRNKMIDKRLINIQLSGERIVISSGRTSVVFC